MVLSVVAVFQAESEAVIEEARVKRWLRFIRGVRIKALLLSGFHSNLAVHRC